MTPEYILRKSLCRSAHCYSSHVPGKGYVGVRHISEGIQWSVVDPTYHEQRRRTAESEIDNLGYATDYAGKGYNTPAKGILFANWNVFPSKVTDLLERYGYAVEWSDEWATCNDCNLAVRTSPDSYSYRPEYGVWDNDFLCLDCFQEQAESWRSDERDTLFEQATEPLQHAIGYLQDIIAGPLDRDSFLDTCEAVDILSTLLEGMER